MVVKLSLFNAVRSSSTPARTVPARGATALVSNFKQLSSNHVADRVLGAFRVGVTIDQPRAECDDLGGEVDLHLVDRVARADHVGAHRSFGEKGADLASRDAGLEALIRAHRSSPC